MNDNETKPAAPPSLESVTCSRCGGSGRYSFCTVHGSVCFKCGGKGKVLTKRGAAASEYLTKLRSKETKDLRPGDVVFFRGGGPIGSAWFAVEKVEPYDNSKSESWIGGVKQALRQDLLSVSGKGHSWQGLEPEALCRFRQTKEQAAETTAQALAYQETLTKSGTVKKR